jgi:flagellar biosynthesis/type III secretory pathway chaperone
MRNPASPAGTPPAGGPLDDLVHCLEAEYAALLAQDYERLGAVLAQKEQLLSRLATLPAGTIGSPQGNPARAAVRGNAALAQLRKLNQRNAQVLAPRAAGNRARLHFLQSALGRTPLYAADGLSQTPLPFGAGTRTA